MPNTFAGVAFLKMDGAQLQLKGNLSYSVQQFSREMMVGQDGVHLLAKAREVCGKNRWSDPEVAHCFTRG